MLTLGQIAAAMGIYASDGAGNSLVTVSRGAASVSDNSIPAGAIIISVVAMLVVLVIVLMRFRLLAASARRNERLIELALKNNQPEIARELIGKPGGFARFLLWIVFIVGAIILLQSMPALVFAGVGLLLIYLSLGSERRAGVLRKTADQTARMQDWLVKKADDNTPKDIPGSDANRSNDDRGQGV